MECSGLVLCAEGAPWRSVDRGELTIVAKPFGRVNARVSGRILRYSPGFGTRYRGPCRGGRWCVRVVLPRRASSAHSHDRHREAEACSHFSTTVEKTVENRVFLLEPVRRRLILLVFPHGERGCGPGSSRFAPTGRRQSRMRSARFGAKVGPHQYSYRFSSSGDVQRDVRFEATRGRQW